MVQIKEPKIPSTVRNNFHMLKYFSTSIETERAKNNLDQIINKNWPHHILPYKYRFLNDTKMKSLKVGPYKIKKWLILILNP